MTDGIDAQQKMEKPWFYNLVNFLYYSVNDHLPESIRKYEKTLAAVEGSAGTVLVLGGIQKVTEKILPQFYNTDFKTLEGLCILILATGTVVYMSDKRELIKSLPQNHPVYTTGMISTWLASNGMALYDILK